MKRRKTLWWLGVVMLGLSLFGVMSCTSDDWAVVADSLNQSLEYHEYYFANQSDAVVTLTDSLGKSISLYPGDSGTGQFNAIINVNSVRYDATEPVTVSQDGNTFYFN
jgi:hypothetical protein